jgi:segregation and condensation protein A
VKSHQPSFEFEAAAEAAEDGDALILDLDGFEGPLHVLLALARTQKVDLLQLSVLKLAEQYAEFVRSAGRRNFALAADYLVMASWLAYLKSRLLLPKPERVVDEPPPEQMAAALAFRLAKLDAMRKAADALQALPQLRRDVFSRGEAGALTVLSDSPLQGDLNALVLALLAQKLKAAPRRYVPRPPQAYALEDARERLRTMLPTLQAWTALQGVAPAARGGQGPSRASCLASTLSASLELVKEGAMETRQREAFADVFLRRRAVPALEAAA